MTGALVSASHSLSLPEEGRRPKVVVTTVSSDAHTWNLVWLQMVLVEHGCNVTNLGPCVPDELVIATCLTCKPKLLVVSSVNGHGAIEGRRLMRRLRQTPGLEDIKAVIGGKLGISGELSQCEIRSLLEAGFNLVINDSNDPDLKQVKALIGNR